MDISLLDSCFFIKSKALPLIKCGKCLGYYLSDDTEVSEIDCGTRGCCGTCTNRYCCSSLLISQDKKILNQDDCPNNGLILGITFGVLSIIALCVLCIFCCKPCKCDKNTGEPNESSIEMHSNGMSENIYKKQLEK